MSYSLKQFVEESEAIVRKYPSESEVLLHLKPLLEKLVQNGDKVPAQVFTPRKDRFAMNLIQLPRDRIYSIIGGVWRPDQATPIHDHLTWALIGVYDGGEREALYRRTDDRSNPKFAKLEKVSERINSKAM